jgi:hypothetical protein
VSPPHNDKRRPRSAGGAVTIAPDKETNSHTVPAATIEPEAATAFPPDDGLNGPTMPELCGILAQLADDAGIVSRDELRQLYAARARSPRSIKRGRLDAAGRRIDGDTDIERRRDTQDRRAATVLKRSVTQTRWTSSDKRASLGQRSSRKLADQLQSLERQGAVRRDIPTDTIHCVDWTLIALWANDGGSQ